MGTVPSRPKVLAAILALSTEDREKLRRSLRAAVVRITNLSGDDCGTGCAVKSGLAIMQHTQTPWENLFKLDRAFLEGLTKTGIEGVLKEAGFAKWFDTQNNKGDFAKLMRAKKDVLIDRVLKADFSFDGFVPKVVSSFKPR